MTCSSVPIALMSSILSDGSNDQSLHMYLLWGVYTKKKYSRRESLRERKSSKYIVSMCRLSNGSVLPPCAESHISSLSANELKPFVNRVQYNNFHWDCRRWKQKPAAVLRSREDDPRGNFQKNDSPARSHARATPEHFHGVVFTC